MADEATTPQTDDAAAPEEETQEETGPKNTVTTEDAGTLKKKVTVTVPPEAIAAKMDEMYGELSNTAQVPGFRVGRAPRRLIEKRFGKDVAEDVRNSIVGEALGDAIEQADLKTIGEPDLDLDEIKLPEEGELTFSFDVEVEPQFDLPELKGIEVKKPTLEVTDERIDEYLGNMVQSRAHYEKTDEPAGDGDGVVCAAKITGDGIDLEKPRQELRVAPGVIEGIPMLDLGKDLAGKKPGDVVELKATVADTHPNEDWRGKDVTIELTVHEVSKRVVPEINDEFAVGMGFDDLAELKEFVGKQMEARAGQEAQQAMRDQLRKSLVDLVSDMELPEGLVKRYTARTLQRSMIQMLQYGVPRERIAEMQAKLQADAEEQAQRDLRLSFLLNKVADENEIEVSEAEVNTQIAQMAVQYGRRPEKLRAELAADGTLEVLADSIREDKALNKILEDAEVTEVAPEDLQEEGAEAEGDEKPEAKKAAKKKTAKKKAAAKKDDAEENADEKSDD